MNDDQVVVKVLAAPVNPSDINIIEGTYPIKPIWTDMGAIGGQEGVGQVVQVGSNVSHLKPGDWVLPVKQSFNTWQTFAAANANSVVKLENIKGISPILASTISVNPPTAYRMIKDFVALEKGDVIIQNSANSAVGQAVIQLARAWGFKTVNIVRNRPDIESLAKSLADLGADLVITEDQVRKAETEQKIKDLGIPRLGLNGVGGKSATNMARLLANDAFMVTYGGMSKEPVTIPTSLLIFKNLTCTGFWMSKWATDRPDSARVAIYSDLFELAKQNKFKEPLHETWSFKDLPDGQLVKIASRPENGFQNGKRILVPE
ncbi:hypothetical protein HK103_001275 [Boothiomyces macroporosus]|uniref:enoyl-[acyl-carrier-protein] reductase n=1 Tax=Boothiomyces macroporosus TaxID=261099 RepID=A0AAD5UAM5_9FUNG|nr:hypothetical protein HK103_001275 [Boothiomyces macroporosus]